MFRGRAAEAEETEGAEEEAWLRDVEAEEADVDRRGAGDLFGAAAAAAAGRSGSFDLDLDGFPMALAG